MQDKQLLKETLVAGAQAFRAGRMNRRTFLALCGAAGVATTAVLAGDAEAAANQIVMWNWGGQAVKCHGDGIGAPYKQKTGRETKFDTSGPLEGKIKEMVNNGNVTADVADADLFNAVSLGPEDVLEPIDYGIVSKERTLPDYALKYGVSIILYGYAFVYDTKVYGDNPPKNWADFFDTKTFPGTRALYKWGNGSLEAALLADGVAPKELYPLDLERALKKIASIKDDSIYWGSGAEAHSMVVNGEVSMAIVWQNRARSIEQDTDGRFKLQMNQALAMPGAYIVPKGNPAGAKAAMEFIATAQEVSSQLALLDCLGMTPSNPEAFSKIPAAQEPYAITSARNIDRIVYNDPEWWGKHGGDAVNAFLETIS